MDQRLDPEESSVTRPCRAFIQVGGAAPLLTAGMLGQAQTGAAAVPGGSPIASAGACATEAS